MNNLDSYASRLLLWKLSQGSGESRLKGLKRITLPHFPGHLDMSVFSCALMINACFIWVRALVEYDHPECTRASERKKNLINFVLNSFFGLAHAGVFAMLLQRCSEHCFNWILYILLPVFMPTFGTSLYFIRIVIFHHLVKGSLKNRLFLIFL